MAKMIFTGISILVAICFSNLVFGAQWTTPTKIYEDTLEKDINLVSAAYDPSSQTTHAFVIIPEKRRHVYFKMSNTGELLRDYTFVVDGPPKSAILKAAKDGRNIYVAYIFEFENKREIMFDESMDLGQHWGNWQVPVRTYDMAYILDMVYITSSVRLFIFYNMRSTNQLRFVTRPLFSKIFSQEYILDFDIANDTLAGKFTYNSKDGIAILHGFYKNSQNKLIYIKSADNGVNWSTPKEICADSIIYGITNANANPKIPDKITVTFIQADAENNYSLKFMASNDNGEHFSKPVTVNTLPADQFVANDGAVMFGTKELPMLATFFKSGIETAIFESWYLVSMQGNFIQNPFNEKTIYGLKLDIYTDEDNKLIKVAALVMKSEGNKHSLWYSQGNGKILEGSSDLVNY